MEQPRITINLDEYENLKRIIKSKDEYITQCVNNGKIKRKDVTSTIFYRDTGMYSYMPEIRLFSEDYTEYLTDSAVEEINNKELKMAIKEIRKYKKKWEDDFNAKSESLDRKIRENKHNSFAERLIYLFTG